MTFEHIRKAKLYYAIEDLKTESQLSIIPDESAETGKSALMWMKVALLSKFVLSVCSKIPPALFSLELRQRVKVLGYYGLALGHLGRFFEAHRCINEASAIHSKIDDGANTMDLAFIRIRRAEIYLMEANHIAALYKTFPSIIKNIKTLNEILSETEIGDSILRNKALKKLLEPPTFQPDLFRENSRNIAKQWLKWWIYSYIEENSTEIHLNLSIA